MAVAGVSGTTSWWVAANLHLHDRSVAVPADPADVVATGAAHPLGFARAAYPVAAVFLLLVVLGFGTAAVLAQTSDPVRVDDVGSFAVPEQGAGRALYVPQDSFNPLDEPPCRAGGGTLEGGSAFTFSRSVAGEPALVVARLGSVEPGARVTCPTLEGQPGWLVAPSGTRWLYTAMALVLLVVVTLVRVVAGAVLGRPRVGGAGPQGAAR